MPQDEQIQEALGCLLALKALLDPEIGFEDAVDVLGRTAGTDNATQDVGQPLGQLLSSRVARYQLFD